MTYEEDLTPFNEVIEIIFNFVILSEIKELFDKYRNEFQKNPNYRKELIDLSKNNINLVLSNFSDNYIENVLKKYYSTDGIVLLVVNELTNRSLRHYVDMIDNSR